MEIDKSLNSFEIAEYSNQGTLLLSEKYKRLGYQRVECGGQAKRLEWRLLMIFNQ